MKYLKLFTSHSDYNTAKSSLDKPNVSHCVSDNHVHYNPKTWADEYLTFVALEDGTISFNIWKSMGTDMITSISYSTDNGETWTTTANQDNRQENLVIDVDVEEGDEVMWKGIATQTGYYDENDYDDYVGSFFSSDCEFDAQGNVMSLLYGDDFKGEDTLEYEGQLTCLFYDYDEEKTCGVVNAKDLSLPATTLVNDCYRNMFHNCTSLTTAPKLPATTLAARCYAGMFAICRTLTIAPELPATILAQSCYSGMFRSCASLTSAPQLPATTLANSCYDSMFYYCTSLINAPALPATTLTNYCYSNMFRNCTSLTTAPELPATTLTNSCYVNMFNGCTALTTAPVLPAETLVSSCYYLMFYNCTNLNYIKAMFTTTPSGSSPNYYTQNWVYGVASSGTFVKNSAAQWNVTGVDGIPDGWTVETASE
jgi:hypothetical protein